MNISLPQNQFSCEIKIREIGKHSEKIQALESKELGLGPILKSQQRHVTVQVSIFLEPQFPHF